MSDFFNKTYMICHANLLGELKKVEGFKVNLGQSLLNQQMQFNPQDVNIQMYLAFFNGIIQLIGYLGSLPIYSSHSQSTTVISIINEKNKVDITLRQSYTLTQSINEGLNNMALITGHKVKTEEKEIVIKEEKYVRPNKKLEEMTQAERIAFARNRI